MAGYIFTLDQSVDALKVCAESGVYGTFLSIPTKSWRRPQEGTFADYATMQPGDHVYFFIDRHIYGIGEMVAVGGDCKHQNFPGASEPRGFTYSEVKPRLLVDEGENSVTQRWVCTFRPSPYFFTSGVDMDDALSSAPEAFRMLRVLWKLSFIKIDDEEDAALRDIILKANQGALASPQLGTNIFQDQHASVHAKVEKRRGPKHQLSPSPLLASASLGNGLRHEMALEAGILWQLAAGEPSAVGAFGDWDYLTHQVMASPFKPPDYADKMDVFGYAYIPGFAPTVSRYLVGELKTGAANTQDVDQVMKYVDWTKDEYCHGDYSMVRAFLVASSFPEAVFQYRDEAAKRLFTVGRRPPKTAEWESLAFIGYRFDSTSKLLVFSKL